MRKTLMQPLRAPIRIPTDHTKIISQRYPGYLLQILLFPVYSRCVLRDDGKVKKCAKINRHGTVTVAVGFSYILGSPT